MKVSIKYKLLPVIVVGILAMGSIFEYVYSNTQETTMRNFYEESFRTAKKSYYNLIDNDIKILKAAMIDFMSNQEYKDLYLENDREKLFNFGQELFAKHKELGITHFYFHRPDGTVLSRLHDGNKYDDKVTRTTFLKSQESKNWGTGIELGATAFALRVVHPYYSVSSTSTATPELIGYIEYGEEIDHFLKIMKDETGNDYAMVVDKKYIKEAPWTAIRQAKNLRNNYSDLSNHVVINSTDERFVEQGNQCWNEAALGDLNKDGQMITKITKDGKVYACGGFPIFDASGNKVGATVMIKDVTAAESALVKNVRDSYYLTFLLVVLTSLILMVATNLIVISPMRRLTVAGNKISDGQLDTEFPILKSNDEIKDLSDTMNMLVGAIKFLKGDKNKTKK